MTNVQKAFCILLSMCFFATLAVLPGTFFTGENVYRHLPLYRFLEKKAQIYPYEDRETYEKIAGENGRYLGEQAQSEQKTARSGEKTETKETEENQKEKINLIIAVGENKEEIKKEIQKYKIEENIKKSVELSKAKNEAQNRYLRIKGTQIRDYQKMMSYIVFYNPTKKLNLEKLPKDKYKQSELWKYGISGDLPIILVKIKDSNDAHVVKEVLKAYEFFRTKNLETELIILDEEKHSYENYVREDVENIIQNSQIAYLKNIRAGIFELSKNEISKDDLNLLNFVSTIIIDANKGGIKNALKELEEEYLEKYKDVGKEQQITLIENENNENIDILTNIDNLKYYNEYGAFSEDGK